MNATQDTVRLPSSEDFIAPVKILDADGQVVRVVSAAEFRETHSSFAPSRLRPADGRPPRPHALHRRASHPSPE
jgi:hypothetical protein